MAKVCVCVCIAECKKSFELWVKLIDRMCAGNFSASALVTVGLIVNYFDSE